MLQSLTVAPGRPQWSYSRSRDTSWNQSLVGGWRRCCGSGPRRTPVIMRQ